MSAPIIIGVDPGFASMGIAVVQLAADGPELLHATCTRTKKGDAARLASEDNTQRGRELYRPLVGFLQSWRPAAIVVEAQSWPRNASATAKMGIAWGLVIAAAESVNGPLVHVTPQALKRAITGRKDASKDDVLDELTRRWPGMATIGSKLKLAGVPRSQWEHPVDAAAAVVAALDTEIIRAIRRVS